jgi:hypothetical protein
MSETYGEFSGNPRTEWLSDSANADREMELLEDFWYIDPDNKQWLAPRGCKIDGASIPRPLWSSIGSPYTGSYRKASIVHDVACQNIDKKSVDAIERRKAADRMFYFACLAGGCSLKEAEILYIGVRIGDWQYRVGNWLPANWKDMLFHFTEKPSVEEAEKTLFKKFRLLASKALEKTRSLTFEELEKIVDTTLK